jgi:hypothetical protein
MGGHRLTEHGLGARVNFGRPPSFENSRVGLSTWGRFREGRAASAHHLIAKLISNRRGSTIDEKTLRKAFAVEIETGKAELDTIVLTQLVAAIKRGEPWAINKHIDQRMWTTDRGGWHPGGPKITFDPGSGGGSEPSGGMAPLTLIVQFEKPDPRLKPVL